MPIPNHPTSPSEVKWLAPKRNLVKSIFVFVVFFARLTSKEFCCKLYFLTRLGSLLLATHGSVQNMVVSVRYDIIKTLVAVVVVVAHIFFVSLILEINCWLF